MFNKSQIAKDQKKAKQPKSLARPKDVDYVSKMGYRDDSPFNKRPYIDINTPSGLIDMSNTGTPLMANGVYLPPYSGTHQFNTSKVRETPVAKNGGTDIYYPPKHNPANSFAVTDPRSMSSGGSYVENQITHFQSGGNMDPGNNALELHMFYDKDVYKKQDGGIILELTDDEIEEYKKGGYVVEDISVPALQDGGKASRQVKRGQRKAARNFEYNPEAEFSMFTQPGEEELPAYEYPGRTVAIDPIEVKPIEITDRETPELDTTAMAEYYANRAKEAREEKRQSLKNTDNITYKKLSRPAGEIVLKDEMNDDMSKALTNAGYYVNQLESGDYEVIANKDIADLIYKKGITANELSTKFNLGDSKTLQQHFQPVYNSAQSIHAKRNVGKINELINQGYTKNQAIKELAKQGEGTVPGLSNLYGNYAEATYQKNKAEADALTALGVTNIKDLTDYQKKQLMNVAAFKTGAEAKLDVAQDEADFLKTYMPEVSDNTAYRGFMGLDASGQPMYGTTAYDKAQNEIAATKAMTDEFKYREGAQAEAAKAILTSSNLTDEQRKQLMENPDKFNEIYQSYVNWMQADAGSIPKYIQREYIDENGTKMISVEKGNEENASEYLKSDFEITPDGASWTPAKEETPLFEKQVVSSHFEFPEVFGIPIAPVGLAGSGSAAVRVAEGVGKGLSTALNYSPIKSLPWLNLGTALEADMAYQAFKDEGYVDQAIQDFSEGNYLAGIENAAMAGLGAFGPLKLISELGQSSKVSDVIEGAGNFLTTQTPLKNTYKINPLRFKADPNAAYRMIGDEAGFQDALTTGVLRPNPQGKYSATFYNVGTPLERYGNMQASGTGRQYIAEVPLSNPKVIPRYTDKADKYRVTRGEDRGGLGHVAVNEPGVTIYKQDWLRGYKPVNTSVQNVEAENIIRAGSGGMDMSRYEIKNPDYYTQLLNTYDSRKLSQQNKKFYTDLINTVKKQNGIVTERQYNELQRLKTGNFDYGKKGYQSGGSYYEDELTDAEIKALREQGIRVEEV